MAADSKSIPEVAKRPSLDEVESKAKALAEISSKRNELLKALNDATKSEADATAALEAAKRALMEAAKAV